jgi:hypothetical protein
VIFRIMVALAAIAIASFPASAADEAEIRAKVEQLNQESMKVLGVSLNALRYLVDASPNSYRPLWYLERSGDIKYIHELELAGYVSTEIRMGLPDGAEPNVKQMRIIPIGSGQYVKQCVVNLGK